MAIEKKSDLFYELLIRGVWDPTQGELGSVSTYQLTTGTAIIDTDTNKLAAPYTAGRPRDLTRDEAVAYLDGQFSGFLDQLSTERAAATDAANTAARVANEAATKAADEISTLSKRLEDLQDKLTNIGAITASVAS